MPDPQLATTLLSLVNLAMTFIAMGIMEKAGRKPLMMCTWVGTCASRRGIRIHVSQPALERTRVSLCSAVFRCIPLYYCYSLSSRGALKTRPDTAFPP